MSNRGHVGLWRRYWALLGSNQLDVSAVELLQ